MFTSFLLACAATILGIRVFDLTALTAPLAREPALSSLASVAVRIARSLPAIIAILAIASCTVAVWLYPVVSVKARGRKVWRSLPSILLLGLIGFGVSLSNTVEAGKALLTRKPWEFVRTPKYALRGAADGWKEKKYQASLSLSRLFEAASAALGCVSLVVALSRSNYGVVPILAVYAAGFSFVAVLGCLQSGSSMRGRR